MLFIYGCVPIWVFNRAFLGLGFLLTWNVQFQFGGVLFSFVPAFPSTLCHIVFIVMLIESVGEALG